MDSKFANNPYYAMAQDFIASHDLKSLAPGKHVIDGDNLWVNIVDGAQKDTATARYEVHDDYIDIQIPLSGSESFGVKPRSACTRPDGLINREKDILFFDDPIQASEIVPVSPGEQITFGPDTAHAPQIGLPGTTVLKAIFKVRVV